MSDVDADADDALCALLSVSARHVLRNLFCHCPPRLKPASAHFSRLFEDARPHVQAFVDSTIIYVLSKQWFDMLSIYAFRLHARPFCEGSVAACGDEAPGSHQALFAVGLLIVLIPIQPLCAKHTARFPALASCPAASAQCVGWAMGAASVQFLAELDHVSTRLSACDSCNILNTAAGILCTVATAALMVGVEPWVDSASEATRSSRCRALLHSGWDLLSRGLKYNVMILWTFCATHAIAWGVSERIESDDVYGRLLVAYALSLTCAILHRVPLLP